MEIEEKTYGHKWKYKDEGSYIHRYYLPAQFREELQPVDIAALFQHIMSMVFEQKSMDDIRALMLAEPCCIRYRLELIVKEIPAEALLPAIDACFNYCQESGNYNLTDNEANFLIALNERLRKLEDDINLECYRLNRETKEKQAKGEPFLDDYEIDVEIQFVLREGYSLFRDDDDNFIFEIHDCKTAGSDDLDAWLKKERELAEGDWNDAKGATNPAIRNNPLFNVPHCWLFHELQSRSPVPLKHLCGIGDIYVDINVIHQGFIKISEE